MKKALFAFAFLLSLFCQAQVTFQKIYTTNDNIAGVPPPQIIMSSDSTYVILGSRANSSGSYLYLFKIDSNGDTLWAKTFLGQYDYAGFSFAQTQDGGYVIGGYNTDLTWSENSLLLKTTSSGNIVWSKLYEKGRISDVWQNSDGGCIFTGVTNNSMHLGKTDSLGNIQWSKTLTDSVPIDGGDIAPTSDGGYVIAGTKYFSAGADGIRLVKINSSGNLIWAKKYSNTAGALVSHVQKTNDGGFIISGHSYYFSNHADIFLLKTDSSGIIQWSKAYRDSLNAWGEAQVQELPNGNYAIFCTSVQGATIIKINNVGDTLWVRSYTKQGYFSYANTGVLTPDDGFLLCGNFSVSGHPGIYLTKTDSTGKACFDSIPTFTVTNIPFNTSAPTLSSLALNTTPVNVSFQMGSGKTITDACLTLPTIGVSELTEKNVFLVSPNPFISETTIKIRDLSFKNTDWKLQIYNIFGQEVHPHISANWEGFLIRKSNLLPGIYFFTVTTNGNIIGTGKLVLE